MSFRPHEGDPSSLPGSRQWPLILNLLPSPRRGPIFSTSIVCGKYVVVDGFRPHEGDPSSLQTSNILKASMVTASVPTKGTHLLYI